MRVLVCGATGCVGRAVASALRSRGHQVWSGARTEVDAPRALHVDFRVPVAPAEWAARLAARRIEAVVNCVGILIPGAGNSFERVHAQGPIELFRGAAAAGVRRVVQVSALGVGPEPGSVDSPYLHSKLRADEALAALPLEWAVLRPSLVYGPHSQSARLFATLASLPLIALPGRGAQRIAPVHVFELAEAVARVLEQPTAPNAVFEIGGPQALGYRDMLGAYRAALGHGAALWLPMPMPLMLLGACVAEALPQTVFSRDMLRLLQRGSVPAHNALPGLLGRAPSPLAHGLAVSRPEPLIDLGVALSAPLANALRASLAAMWLWTALVSAALPETSGVMRLLARCGFEGPWGLAALAFSCSLNVALGAFTLLRPGPWVYALQAAAVLGYTATAAIRMPALTIDHCGPLVKNLPVLMVVMVLWLAAPNAAPSPAPGREPRRQPNRSAIAPATITPVPTARRSPNRSLSSSAPSSAANSTEVSRNAATAATGARVIAHSAIAYEPNEAAPPSSEAGPRRLA
jgi:uncharacterized protein YbjT (DUF2867 family)